MKKIFLICAMFACGIMAMAAVVTQQQAMQIAQQFFGGSTSTSSSTTKTTTRTLGNISVGGVSLGKVTTPQLVLSYKALSKARAVDYYVFNKADKSGYIIVSGDDRFAPVLGYGDSGTFDANNLPDGLQYLLGEYQREMEYLKANPDKAAAYNGVSRDRSVGPLIKTKWGQRSPYNDMCPYGFYAGCVAVATAQILKYHQWPDKGIGVVTYDDGIRNSSYDLSKSVYRWNLMDNTYSSSSLQSHCDAVALLMRDVGMAAHMNYGSIGSAAYSLDMKNALAENFCYDRNVRIINHDGWYYGSDYYTNKEWDQILVDELDAGRPVYLAGNDYERTLAHAFVIDGYDKYGRFHVNWGWYGTLDGYFYTTIMQPSDHDFSYNQDMIYNIKPRPKDLPILPSFTWEPKASVMPSNNVQTVVKLKGSKDPFAGRIAMVVYKIDDSSNSKGSIVTNPVTQVLKSGTVIKSELIWLNPNETKEVVITGSILQPVGTRCGIIVCYENQVNIVQSWIALGDGIIKTDTGLASGYQDGTLYKPVTFVVGDPVQKSLGKPGAGSSTLDDLNVLIDCMLNGNGVVDNAIIDDFVNSLLNHR